VTETTALGAAYLAGLAVGFWDRSTASYAWTPNPNGCRPPAINGRARVRLAELTPVCGDYDIEIRAAGGV
jgi:glycerol kinase